jgi:glycosyltransferase involved in cell wall biosynthesis
MSKILVFIPSYRCEKQIPRVLDQFDDDVQRLIDTVMVVDNRSPDRTLEAAIEAGTRKFTRSRFVAWRNDDNYGLGGSHKAAFRYAIDHGFDYMIVLHGDDQADVRDLLPYLQSGAYAQVDCLLGARFMKGSRLQGYSWFRTFGNHVYNTFFSVAALRNIHDLGSGLNMYSLEACREFYYKSFPDDLTFNYVMLLASYHRGQSVRFFPISWREEDQISNVRLFRQAARVLFLLLSYFFGRGRFFKNEMRARPFESYAGSIVHDSAGTRG